LKAGAAKCWSAKKEVITHMSEFGGVVLCGGKSSRMGSSKALLPFGPECMLQRVVRILGEVVSPIVVVSAPDQPLPELPAGVLLAQDEHEGRGPLQGMAAGLAALTAHVSAAYVTSCDVPLLQSAFIRYVLSQLTTHDIAVPVDEKYHHPLAAAYRTRVAPVIQQLLSADRLRPIFLFDEVATVRIPVADLRAADAELLSLQNLNHPSDYQAALARAGFSD
jgi:molybdenum cofactor guanylyltransferase